MQSADMMKFKKGSGQREIRFACNEFKTSEYNSAMKSIYDFEAESKRILKEFKEYESMVKNVESRI